MNSTTRTATAHLIPPPGAYPASYAPIQFRTHLNDSGVHVLQLDLQALESDHASAESTRSETFPDTPLPLIGQDGKANYHHAHCADQLARALAHRARNLWPMLDEGQTLMASVLKSVSAAVQAAGGITPGTDEPAQVMVIAVDYVANANHGADWTFSPDIVATVPAAALEQLTRVESIEGHARAARRAQATWTRATRAPLGEDLHAIYYLMRYTKDWRTTAQWILNSIARHDLPPAIADGADLYRDMRWNLAAAVMASA